MQQISDAIAVTPRETCRLLSIGNTHLYKLIGAGELVSFRSGRARHILLASIRSYIERRLGNTATTSDGPPRRKRGRPRKRKTERAQIELRT